MDGSVRSFVDGSSHCGSLLKRRHRQGLQVGALMQHKCLVYAGYLGSVLLARPSCFPALRRDIADTSPRISVHESNTYEISRQVLFDHT